MSRQNRLMQEALDKNLPAEELHQLYAQMDQSPADAAEFQRLKQVDRMLKGAPMERAPQALALKIMARLAEGLQPEQLRRSSGLALALGLALVALILTPLLAILGWMIISLISSAAALGTLIGQVINLLAVLMNSLDALVRGAQEMLRAYPEAPVLIGLIPLALFWLARFAWQNRNEPEA
jgi:anti-sigma factor RsiW